MDSLLNILPSSTPNLKIISLYINSTSSIVLIILVVEIYRNILIYLFITINTEL